ncbi:MAG: hypothetical protein KBA53_07930 [Thermoclostridium sp.]|nr:hypothetical protein [Thermoclostridium sp.]
MRMGWFFIFLSVIMCIVLIGVQVIRIYPIWTEIPEDPWQGEPLNSFQSLIVRGSVTLDVLGQYKMHEVMIYKNGERFLLVEKFPVEVKVLEGDVLEVWALEGLDGTSVYVAGTSGSIALKYSRTSLPLTRGLHRIGKVISKE